MVHPRNNNSRRIRGGNNIMKNLFDAELEIIEFNVNDIITTSLQVDGEFEADDIFRED